MRNLYGFGEFFLDPNERVLCRAGFPVSLTPKAFDVLLFLAQNPNRLITRDELLQAVWGNTFVEEGNLTQYISHVRKALGDSRGNSRLIITIARKGYQFTPRVAARTVEIVRPAAHEGATRAISTTDTRLLEPARHGPTTESPRTNLRFEFTLYCKVIRD
jgi:DNA-binding winged helix-turn-helix (wHTH) protein